MDGTNEKFKLRQVRVRLALEEDDPIYGSTEINSPGKAVVVMAEMMSKLDREVMCVVNLDQATHPLSYSVVAMGSSEAATSMQNLFKAAVLSNASGLIALHNHVSGDPRPSRIDVEATKRMIGAGNIMGIPLLDHVIIAAGTKKYYSFMEGMPELFGKEPRSGMEMKA